MSPRPWLEPVYTADEMRALDRWAIDQHGTPSLDLMERAGAEVARVVVGLDFDGPVRLVCGRGNNGGDGLVLARLLREHGLDVDALLLFAPEDLSDDARANLERVEARRVDVDDLPAALERSAVVVDAILGTGFSGSPRPPLDAGIAAINSAGATVVAVDVPSGVDASTGEIDGACVRADVTVTLHGHKLGLWIAPGKLHAGRVEVVDIGIPPTGEGRPQAPESGLIEPSVLGLLRRRAPAGNKFQSGSVLVVGGSTGLTGAACLACDAAMRAGAGWTRAAVPASLNAIFEVKLTEVMSVPLPDRDGHLLVDAAAGVLEAAERADAVALGPGLGREDGTFALAQELVERLEPPLLVDADGLNALAAAELAPAARRAAPLVLTPHAGELARLLGTDSKRVEAGRLASARRAAEQSGGVVLLKGDDTLVVQGGGSGGVAISRGGSPALATAGTGDVLSGVIAAFMARGLDAFEAACAGVYAHAEAGRTAERQLGAESVIAGDVIDCLPAVLRNVDDTLSRLSR
jgi:ADP-dependent NAD(P)H-hydrate dehydratase / NAD(P)H-hydrate epimerase